MNNCCFNSEENKNEIIINQLRQEIEELSKSTNATLLIQNGKIAAACDYIQTNLSNELRARIDTMISSGELHELISETLSNLGYEIEKLDVFYDCVTTEEHIDEITSCKYYLTHIPHCDSVGNHIELQMGIANDKISLNTLESTLDFAHRTGATVCINGGLADEQNNAMGIIIKDGVILKNTPYTKSEFDYLAIMSDGTLTGYPVASTSAAKMITYGVKHSLMGFYTIINNGVSVVKSDENSMDLHPRQVIAQLYNKDIVILTTEGRTKDGEGMKTVDVQRILLQIQGMRFAYMLDGGGSTSTVVNGSKINNDLDGSGTRDRAVSTFLYVSKPAYNNTIADLYSRIGNLEREIKDIIDINTGYLNLYAAKEESYPGISFFPNGRKYRSGKAIINDSGFYAQYRADESDSEEIVIRADKTGLYDKGGALGVFRDIPSYVADCNIQTERSGIYLANNSTLNRPTGSGYVYILHLRLNSSFIKQLSIPATDDVIYFRTWNGAEWSAWSIANVLRGTTANRPISAATGTMYFDSTLNKPVWKSTTGWVDANGSTV